MFKLKQLKTYFILFFYSKNLNLEQDSRNTNLTSYNFKQFIFITWVLSRNDQVFKSWKTRKNTQESDLILSWTSVYKSDLVNCLRLWRDKMTSFHQTKYIMKGKQYYQNWTMVVCWYCTNICSVFDSRWSFQKFWSRVMIIGEIIGGEGRGK